MTHISFANLLSLRSFFHYSKIRSTFPHFYSWHSLFLNKTVVFSVMSAYFPEYQSNVSFQHYSLNLISITFYFIIFWLESLTHFNNTVYSKMQLQPLFISLLKKELRKKNLDIFIYFTNFLLYLA